MFQPKLSFGKKTVSLVSQAIASRPRKSNRSEGPKLSQPSLDMGQNLAVRTCPHCGMIYNNVQADLETHRRICKPSKALSGRDAAVALAKHVKASGTSGFQPAGGTVYVAPVKDLGATSRRLLADVLLAWRGHAAEVAGEYLLPTAVDAWEATAVKQGAEELRVFAVIEESAIGRACTGLCVAGTADKTVPLQRKSVPCTDSIEEHSSSQHSRSSSPDPESPPQPNQLQVFRAVTCRAMVVDMWLLPPKSRAEILGPHSIVEEAGSALLLAVCERATYGSLLSMDQILFAFHIGDPAASGSELAAKALRAHALSVHALHAPLWFRS